MTMTPDLLTDELLTKAGDAVFDAKNGIDGDSIGCMIHENFRIDGSDGNNGLTYTKAVCLWAARAALLSVLPDIRRAVLEEAAKACEQYVHHQHPTKPIGVIISSSPPSLAHANAIRALAKEGT